MNILKKFFSKETPVEKSTVKESPVTSSVTYGKFNKYEQISVLVERDKILEIIDTHIKYYERFKEHNTVLRGSNGGVIWFDNFGKSESYYARRFSVEQAAVAEMMVFDLTKLKSEIMGL